MDETWEPFKQQCSFGKWRALERKSFVYLGVEVLMCNIGALNEELECRK
jgi:hypothetical protein